MDKNAEETRLRIIKISKIIQVTTSICMLLFGVFIFAGLALAFFPFDEENAAGILVKIVDSANLLPINIMNTILYTSHIKLQISLAGIFISLLAVIIVYCIYEYKKIFKTIIKAYPGINTVREQLQG